MPAATPVVVKGQPVAASAPEGKWSTGLCQCTADWTSCLAVACCSPVTTAQLFTKFFGGQCSILPPSLLCLGLALFLFVGMFMNVEQQQQQMQAGTVTIVNGESVIVADGAGAPTNTGPVDPTMGLIVFAAQLFACLTVCHVRKFIRKRDGIPEENCSGCEDCLCGCVCQSCTQCMILRHEGLVSGRYSLCSPIGNVIEV